MAASTVNIADFRYREVNSRSVHAHQRAETNPVGLRVVEPEGAPDERPSHPAENASIENPAILDINTAREKQHIQRLVLRPALISRNRSNLVRFNEPRVTVMKVRQPHSIQTWAQVADDYDHPPAA